MLNRSLEDSCMPDVCVRPASIDLIDWASGVSGVGQILGSAQEEIGEGGSTLHRAVRFHLCFWRKKA